ncbi:hypothetical protein KKH05_02110 [Patescibacteria group bacterium]|nr:hypothetical protein [Patescibacteria group bacterium]
MFQNSYIAELVHDISFAVFRISALVEHTFLKKELEKSAVDLSAYIDEEAIHKMERLVVLAQSIGEIGQVNAEVIIRELGNLKDLLFEEESEESLEADISGLFQKESQPLPFKKEKVNGNKTSSSVSPSKRQTEILSYIRQYPDGCRMADLAGNFQEVSKRTLRNDVTSLIEGSHIERIGNRGPYSYLKALSRGVNNEDDLNNDSQEIKRDEGPTILLSGPQVGVFDRFE